MQRFWLWLATRKGLGPRGAYLAASRFASVEALYYADAAVYEAAGLKHFEPLLDKDLWLAKEILRRCYDLGISILTWQDAAYPKLLRALEDPPVALYYRGQLPDFHSLSIALVGTRGASPYGMAQARRLGYGLSRCGCTLVSGGAKGIDTAALEGALTGGGPVVCVLGGGVDVVYPASNRSLFRDIAQRGCLISEYPPGTHPKAEHFPVRNRIISGLCQGIVVVEAPEKSGALITAHWALDQGRDVFALPGNLGVANFGGNLRLLREGAILVRDVGDILQEYQGVYPALYQNCAAVLQQQRPLPPEAPPAAGPPPENAAPSAEAAAPENLAPQIDQAVFSAMTCDEQAICRLLQTGTKQIDNIVDEAQIPAGRALAALTLLEVKGIVRRLPARRFALVQANST